MNVKTINRFLSYIMIFVITISNASSFSMTVVAEDFNYTQSTTEVSLNNYDTSNLELTMQGFITHDIPLNVKSCDIVLMFDQSRASGKDRQNILQGINDLISNLPTPTDNGQHRIAIGGFGRINNYGEWNDADITYGYPENNFCYNTGYYTNQPYFNSWGSGYWSEGSGYNNDIIPHFNNRGYNQITYNNCFMSIDEAKNIINDDTMVTWNAGASRTDVGFVLASELAKAQNKNNERYKSDRPLMIIFVTCASPIQNAGDIYNSKKDAVLQLSNDLKSKATIYGIGDYQTLNDTQTDYDTQLIFDEIMSQTTSTYVDSDGVEHPRYYSTREHGELKNSITELIKTINSDMAVPSQYITLSTQSGSIFDSVQSKEIQLNELSEILARYNLDTTATINYYKALSYNQDGTINFSTEPYKSVSDTISIENGNISYTGMVSPIMSYDAYLNSNCSELNHGDLIEVVITNKKINSLLVKKEVQNITDTNDINNKFIFHIEGTNDDNSKIYETYIEVSPNTEGVLLNNLPSGEYSITELDTQCFDFQKNEIYQNGEYCSSYYDKTIYITFSNLGDNFEVIYNNSKNNDIPFKTTSFKNIITI